MSWSDNAWKLIEDVYQKILDGPFVSELAKGTLREERFLEYMVQDRLYLREYGKALSLIAARAPTSEDSAKWSDFSIESSTAETQLHDFYLQKKGGTDEVDVKELYIENLKLTDDMKKELIHDLKNPTNELYTSFLLKHAALSPLPVAVAAVLPCFWIYSEVGHLHVKSLKDNPNNKYRKWLELYGRDGIEINTEYVKQFINKLAEKAEPEVIEAMNRAFYTASVCELKFWQAAYDNEKWL